MVETRLQAVARKMSTEGGTPVTTPTASDINSLILTKLNSMESKLGVLDEINGKLTRIQEDYAALAARVDAVEGIEERGKTLERDTREMKTLKEEYKEEIRKTKLKSMLQECHSKRYNIIVYKVPQEDTWEKIFVSESKVRMFLRDMVRIDEADTCLIADCHRLRTYSGRMPQPLIFRVGSMSIKRKIANNLKNLSTYNANLDKKDKVFVELDHLPERLKKDKKILEEQFKVA